MAQETEHSRPVHLTDAQIKDLAAGKKSIGFGEMAKPQDLTAKDVEALREGKKVNLEKPPR
jgi:hypothetical protein